MAVQDHWYYVWEVSFSFSTDTLRSPHPRKDFKTAWDEGAEFVRKCALNHMSVSLRVKDIRKKTWDFSLHLDPEEEV